jgi:hypothetical protein
MTDDREFLRATTDWLEAGSDRTPPSAIDAVLLAVRTTRQERVLPSPWRPVPMQTFARVMLAAAAVVAISVAWLNFGPSRAAVGGVATPAPTPSPSPTPTPLSLAVVQAAQSLQPNMRYTTAAPFPIRMTFAAPAGWQGNVGGPYAVWLGPNGTDGGAMGFELSNLVMADPCHSDRGHFATFGPTPAEFVAGISGLPGVVASTPVDTTVGGLPAIKVTLRGPSDVTGCGGGVFMVWQLPLGATDDLVPGHQLDVWVIDTGGRRLLITANNTTTADAATIQGVVDSIQFEPGS